MKILLAFVVSIVSFIGGSYYISNLAQKAHDNALEILQNLENVEISNVSYEKGLFSSKTKFDAKIDSKTLEILAIAQDPQTKKLNLHFEGKIKNNIFNIFSGIKFDINASIKEQDLEKFFGLLDNVVELRSLLDIFGSTRISMDLKKINFTQNETVLEISGIGFKLFLNKKKEINKAILDLKNMVIKNKNIEILLENFNYSRFLKFLLKFYRIEF